MSQWRMPSGPAGAPEEFPHERGWEAAALLAFVQAVGDVLGEVRRRRLALRLERVAADWEARGELPPALGRAARFLREAAELIRAPSG